MVGDGSSRGHRRHHERSFQRWARNRQRLESRKMSNGLRFETRFCWGGKIVPGTWNPAGQFWQLGRDRQKGKGDGRGGGKAERKVHRHQDHGFSPNWNPVLTFNLFHPNQMLLLYSWLKLTISIRSCDFYRVVICYWMKCVIWQLLNKTCLAGQY